MKTKISNILDWNEMYSNMVMLLYIIIVSTCLCWTIFYCHRWECVRRVDRFVNLYILHPVSRVACQFLIFRFWIHRLSGFLRFLIFCCVFEGFLNIFFCTFSWSEFWPTSRCRWKLKLRLLVQVYIFKLLLGCNEKPALV